MQTFRLAPVPLLFFVTTFAQTKPTKPAAPPRTHAVVLGSARRVPYLPPDTTPDAKDEDTTSLKVRPLIVDERQREWTTGDLHEVTDRSFTIRRVLHVNDALPQDREPHWVWQPGPWLLVDRVTGHITALHLPEFDSLVSNIAWYRDYAAYCGIASTAKGGLVAVVAQIGSRRPAAQRPLGPWPQANHFIPVCQPAQWQRLPMRVTLKPTGGEAVTFDVIGSVSLIEDGDSPEDIPED